ncbi:MAG: hypothetical protein GWN59_03865, partial [Calditrichae bacterium]|nr:hypothetical protein [Calditrichia bacterium]
MEKNRLKKQISELIFKWKARAVARRLNQSVNFPMGANSIQNVLVILPRNLELFENASAFIQSLRKAYPKWHIELFDVDKLKKNDLNRVEMPRAEIIQKLKKASYSLVLDLNDDADQLTSFITLMTEAPYRLHLKTSDSFYYNIVYQPQKNGAPDCYE